MKFNNGFLSDKSEESLLNEIRRVASLIKKDSLTQSDFNLHGRVSSGLIKKRFGSWNIALEKAGLKITKRMNVSDEDIFSEIGRIWNILNHRPSQDEFDKLSIYSVPLLKLRFGSYLKTIDKFTKSNENVSSSTKDNKDVGDATKPTKLIISQVSNNKPGRKYGGFINFRGMQHTPLNELGVVFLFGMMAKELGFIVESINKNFPDCEAKKEKVGKSGKYYEKVSIEFEYQSGNFLKHKHDTCRCNLIVCWKNNWPDCPIEVIELKEIISKANEGV